MLKTIRGKLFAILSILAFFIFLSFTISYSVVQEHNDDELVNDIVARGIYLVEIINQKSINPSEFVDPAYEIQQFEEIILLLEKGGTFTTQDGMVISITNQAEIAPFVVRIKDAWDAYQAALAGLNHTVPISEEHERAETILLADGNALVGAIYELLGFLEEDITFHHDRMIWLNVLFIGLSVPLLLFSFYLIDNRITKPLNNLSQAARQYRKGDFEYPFTTSGEDEIGDLGRAFEGMKFEIQTHQSTLEKEISDRIQEIATAFEFSQDIVSQLEFQQLLSSATQKVKQLLNANAVTICLVNAQNDTLSQVASTNQLIGDPYPTQSLDIRKPFIRTEQNNTIVEHVRPGGCEFLKHASASNRCFATPLRVGQELIGEMCILRDEHTALGDNEKRALLLLSNSIAVAIQNAQLTEHARQQALERAKLGERERLASDLHDNLAQTLNHLNKQTEDLVDNLSMKEDQQIPEEIKDIRKNLDIALGQVRMAISADNVPVNQANQNYWQDLQQYVDQYSVDNDIQVYLCDGEPILARLGGIEQKQIFYILREALTNIKKHARATLVEISFEESSSGVSFKITDNGVGFDPRSKHGDHHLGLQIMKARAERTGGTLVIQSQAGQGTTILARFPNKPGIPTGNKR
jgi:two-component system nitrate/nitrite sensor histidine kinase NarX